MSPEIDAVIAYFAEIIRLYRNDVTAELLFTVKIFKSTKTSRERHKSALYLRLKNSKRA